MSKKNNTKKKIIEELCSDEKPEICFVDNPAITGETIQIFAFDSSQDETK